MKIAKPLRLSQIQFLIVQGRDPEICILASIPAGSDPDYLGAMI